MVVSLLKEGAKTDIIDYTSNSVLDAALTAASPRVIGAILDLKRPCSIEAPWDAMQPEIERFASEPWFEQLRLLIAKRAQRKEPAYQFHQQAILQEPRVVYDHEEDKTVLECEIGDANNKTGIKVQKVTFTFRSRDQGMSFHG